MTVAVAVLAVVWVGYALFGRRWRVEPRLAPAPAAPAGPRSVVAVVAARNEADQLPQTLGALLTQTGAAVHVMLVDDHSSDGTADVARRIAAAAGTVDRLTVLTALELPPGWTGKVWAQAQGIEAAAARGAEWIWLTDADIHHGDGVLARLLATAEREDRDLVSAMARLRCDTAWEKLLIPAFTYFFAALYSFAHTRDDRSRTAGAAGGCILVRRAVLERAGGIAAIRDAVIDDCALARICKAAGGRLWLGYDPGVCSTRGYAGLRGIWDMVARSAYTQLRHSPLALAGSVLGLLYVFLLPIAALSGAASAVLLGSAAYAAMIRTYLPMVTYLSCGPAWALVLPVSAALYTAMTISSAWRHHRGRGAAWKGRTYGARASSSSAPDLARSSARPRQ
ncbi:MAG: glycosyltransferase [Candidatus Binatia bacterium]